MRTIVLVHGSWQGGWCWERVVPLLRDRGHEVVAPDSPGMGDDHTPFAPDVMAQWIDAVSAIVASRSEPVLLVGHSRGGTIVGAVADRLPGQVHRAVLVASFLPRNGESLIDAAAASGEAASAIVLSADGTMSELDRSRAKHLLYGEAAPAIADEAVRRLRPEPVQPWSIRQTLSPERFGRVPLWFVETANDRVFPLASQRRSQAYWPHERVIAIASDHSPFYSQPERLTDALHEAAA